jgi:uncharacterized protein YndB with AHSA1/START domain
MSRPTLLTVLALPGLLLAGAAGAAVLDSADHGFTVQNTVEVAAAPGPVYAALVQRVGAWWSSDHTFSGDAANLSIDPRPGGCFCERLPDGGGVIHLTVVYADPGKLLRLRGGLGPLQGTSAAGSLTFALSPVEGSEGQTPEDRTRVELTYQVGGYLPDGLDGWAAAVDGVLAEQLGRLARYAETGSPEPARP